MLKFLINPFENSTDRKLLIFGCSVFVGMVFLSWHWNILADGIVQLHNNTGLPLWKVFLNTGLNIILLSLLMFIIAKLIYPKSRLIDVITVVLVANVAQMIVMLLLFNPYMQGIMKPLEKAILAGDLTLKTVPQINLVIISLAGILAIAFLYYFFHLLVLGMKIAMNSKKGYHVLLIIILTMLLDTFLHILNPYLS